MNIEILEDGTVLKDGENVGSMKPGPGIEFEPKPRLHPKTAAAVSKRVVARLTEIQTQGALEAGETHALPEVGSIPTPATFQTVTGADPEPEQSNDAGDKTPAFVAWFQRNHTKEQFEARYAGRIPQLQ
jgi:hypothetical protein